MEIKFSWDAYKANNNLKNCGVCFEDATLIFYDVHGVDQQHFFENANYRCQALGMRHGQAVLSVEHALQEHNWVAHICIISAPQKAIRASKQYEQNCYLPHGYE